MAAFDFSDKDLEQKKATFTATEIHQQPSTWKKTLAQVESMKEDIRRFIAKVTSQPDYDIVLTGAGTSEFVGNALFSYLNRLTNYKCKSYGTTDITATPENYISPDKPTLLISYGRSGDSPESNGVAQSAGSVSH